ncbi:MAG: glycosyltransferase, partial [Arenicellales bacterium]
MGNNLPTILILITKADVGGAQVHVLEILKQLKPRYHFILATGEEDFLSKQAREIGIEVRILKHLKRAIRFQEDKFGLQEIKFLLQDIKPDIFHCHSSKAGVLGRLAAWRTGTKTIFTAHGWAFTEGAPKLQRSYGLLVESLLCRLVGSVITISDYDFKLAQRFKVGTAQKRFLIKNGVAKPQAFSARKTSQVLNILTIGRL